ncbi:MAG: glycosyltransferase family 4 protein [Acidimicrobiales bacterium]
MTRVVLDGTALRRQGKGVARVLRHVLPLVGAGPESGDLECAVLTTEEGSELLGSITSEIVVVPEMPQSVWEQLGLPWYARKLGGRAIYSQSECGPLWGPPVVLHVLENPHTRWQGAPAGSSRERVRRIYQRLAMARGLRHAPVVVTSCNAVGEALAARFGRHMPRVVVIPLGVDTDIFHPDPMGSRADAVFHLGSADSRDQSIVVVRAYARALRSVPDLPDLVIAGNLGSVAPLVSEVAHDAGIEARVHLLGRVSDDDLRQSHAHAALCVQPARYEGFGLQPLEALACGAPLVVFAEPSVQEVVGDAAMVLFDKTEDALAGAIAQLWQDETLRASFRELGPKRAAELPWSATVRKLEELLRTVAQHA